VQTTKTDVMFVQCVFMWNRDCDRSYSDAGTIYSKAVGRSAKRPVSRQFVAGP